MTSAMTAPSVSLPGSGTAPDPASTASALTAIVSELGSRFYERSGVIWALVVALLAGKHSLAGDDENGGGDDV